MRTRILSGVFAVGALTGCASGHQNIERTPTTYVATDLPPPFYDAPAKPETPGVRDKLLQGFNAFIETLEQTITPEPDEQQTVVLGPAPS